MNNNNNNSNNGKEILKGQLPLDDPKKNNQNSVNRIKKKNISSDNKVNPTESKKVPLTVNKNPGNLNKNTPKGQVIKLGDKEGEIRKVRTEVKKQNPTGIQSIDEKDNNSDTSTFRSTTKSFQNRGIEKNNYKISSNLGTMLLLAAIILFVAWVVIFFYYNTGGNVHMLLALAVVCGIISLLGKKK